MILIVIVIFTIYIVHFYVEEFSHRRKCPPGPLPLPVIGNLLDLALASNVPTQAITNLIKPYGEICRFKTGSTHMVVLSSLEALRTIWENDDSAGRDMRGTIMERNLGERFGLGFSEGAMHHMVKTWTVKNLKELGFGKSSSMEGIIQDQAEELFRNIESAIEKDGGIVQINHFFILAAFKVSWQLIQGEMAPEDEPVIKNLLLKSEQMVAKGIMGAGLVNAFPFLRFVAPEFTGQNVSMSFYNDCHATSKKLLADALSNMRLRSDKTPGNFIEAFAKKMEEDVNNPATIFTEKHFQVLFVDLLQASSDTSSSLLESAILFCVLQPDVQNKIYEEIQNVVPADREIQAMDKKDMVYTQAFFLETHRCAPILQNLIPRRAMKDIQFKDYLIRKDTIIMADLVTIYHDPKTWDDPDSFQPERFLDENGQLINKNKVIAFGIGKRSCPGEAVGTFTSFLVLTNILRRYKVSLIPRKFPPRSEMHVSYTSKPYPFEVVFSQRKPSE